MQFLSTTVETTLCLRQLEKLDVSAIVASKKAHSRDDYVLANLIHHSFQFRIMNSIAGFWLILPISTHVAGPWYPIL